jgi:histidinol-phosphate/aromatic aminotransferase/cobyric acid decarboxylase-like protein
MFCFIVLDDKSDEEIGLQKEVKEKGVSVVVASNPRNPTGQAIDGKDLETLVEMARKGTTVVLDEVRAFWRYEQSHELTSMYF